MRSRKTYTYVDGYNVINAWPNLRALIDEINLAAARDELIDILAEYKKLSGEIIYLVFDGQEFTGPYSEDEIQKDIHIIYTKDRDTADSFIERQSALMNHYDRLKVISSDGMIQQIILGKGGSRVSSLEFYEDMKRLKTDLRRRKKLDEKNNYTNLVSIDEDTKDLLNKLSDQLKDQ